MNMMDNIEKNLEIWGGVECTVNRVANRYSDQLELSKHFERPSDLKSFAKIGIKALRFPVIWERLYRLRGQIDWSTTREFIEEAHFCGLDLIVGFLHHGSGPPSTHLLDPDFSRKFCDFVCQFCEEFPQINRFTPINEPLTTARFSGLYGHWYPHRKSSQDFFLMLYNECLAISQSMALIRRRNPQAQLIQTEDIGQVDASPSLKHQADYENLRRWLGFDILTGKFSKDHPLWVSFLNLGVDPLILNRASEIRVHIDLIGVNHYLTSHRYLDAHYSAYPPHLQGGNGRDRYADVETCRVFGLGLRPLSELLLELWQRYKIPLAVTEAFLGCDREDQLRWFYEVWQEARKARAEGVPVKAVTAWSLLGSFDWASLVTEQRDEYEIGAFDLRSPSPRPTALAKLIKNLAENTGSLHPVLKEKGWWQREKRFIYRLPESILSESTASVGVTPEKSSILILGAEGKLGKELKKACQNRGLSFFAPSKQQVDISNVQAISIQLKAIEPWAVVNACGSPNLAFAEQNQRSSYNINTLGPAYLAKACAERKIALLNLSSDLVFDGELKSPYFEESSARPLNFLGKAKLMAEQLILKIHPDSLFIRTSYLFGHEDGDLAQHCSLLESSHPSSAAVDQILSPTYLPHLAKACLDLLIDGENGIWHLCNEGEVSPYELAKQAAIQLGLPLDFLRPRSRHEHTSQVFKPAYSALKSQRGLLLPSLDQALTCFVRQRKISQQGAAV